MWGRNSHVISTRHHGGHPFHQPELVKINGESIRFLSSGAWHAAALPGKPGNCVFQILCL